VQLEVQAMADQAPDEAAREFAASFRRFLDWIHSSDGAEGNEVSVLVRDYLGPDGAQHSVVTRELAPFEHVNLQTALDAWSARAGRTVEVLGIAVPPHYGGVSLQQLVAGEGLPPLRLTAPALTDLPNGPGSTLGCLRLALLLVADQHGRYVVMIQAPNEHHEALETEVAGLPVDLAQRLLGELDELRNELNVYAATCSMCRSIRWAGWSSPLPARRGSAAMTSCCRPPCWPGSNGMRWGWPATGRRCWPPGSISSAACCCTGRPAPARRTPCAICWAR
jgi:hypothetical protein